MRFKLSAEFLQKPRSLTLSQVKSRIHDASSFEKIEEIVNDSILDLSEQELINQFFEEDNLSFEDIFTGYFPHRSTRLRMFSENHPYALFHLICQRDNCDNLWKEYYYQGKMHVADSQIFFDGFNPEKLK